MIVDSAPRESVEWRQAASELCRIASACQRLALKTGDRTLIDEAARSSAIVQKAHY